MAKTARQQHVRLVRARRNDLVARRPEVEVQLAFGGVSIMLRCNRGHAEAAVVLSNHLPKATIRLGVRKVVFQPGVQVAALAHVEDRQCALGIEYCQLVDARRCRGVGLDIGPR